MSLLHHVVAWPTSTVHPLLPPFSRQLLMECAPGRCNTLGAGERHCLNSAIQTKTFPETEVRAYHVAQQSPRGACARRRHRPCRGVPCRDRRLWTPSTRARLACAGDRAMR